MTLSLPQLDWRTTTQAVEQIVRPPAMLQDLIFKRRNPNPADTVEIDLLVGGKRLAPFVTDMQGGVVVTGSSRKSRVVKTGRIRIKHPLDAKKLIGERGLGQSYYAGGVQDIQTAMLQKIAVENRELKNMIARRTEWMCAQALTGTLTVEQENIEFQVDFLIPAEHKITLAADDMWSATDGDPLNDVQTWADLLINKGYTPDVMICGTTAAKYLRNKVKADNWFDARRVTAGQFAWQASANYMGNLEGIDVYRYGSQYEDAAGADQNFIAADKVYLVATQAKFTVEFGLILDLKAGASVVGEVFAKQWEEEDPSVLWLLQESRPLPVPWEPEAIIEADVC